MRLVWLVSLASLVPSLADALCMAPVERPKVITAEVSAPADGGGVVVGTEIGHDGKQVGGAEQPTWVFKHDKTSSKPVIVQLAPGLVAYQLPDKVERGELFDGTKAIAKLARSTTTAAKLTAPVPTKITYKAWPGRRGKSTQVTAVFADGKVPGDAVALVVADAKSGKARSYALTGSGNELTLYYQGRCSALPDGTLPTNPNDKVVVRWVDKYGRMSPDSKALVVAKIK